MPQMVQSFADSAGISVITGMHAPPGVSVGDTSQGNMAHMNNPALFTMIRSQKWDFAVIQDNQGRFVRDSAVFPGFSKVVQGHLNIMDSVKANNSCAKIILFAGWAFKNGSPPFGNTGIEMIDRILCNYVVLNDTMKEVISPIGEAWIRAINYLPSVNLWDVDDAHPSYAGSYITASAIFSTIFNLPAKTLNYNGSISTTDAFKLRAFADSSVFNSATHVKYNLGGIKTVSPVFSNGQLSVPGNYNSYSWYKNKALFSGNSSITTAGNGSYMAVVTETDGCIVKTCEYSEIFTGVGNHSSSAQEITVFPNPVQGKILKIKSAGAIRSVSLLDLSGRKVSAADVSSQAEIEVPVENLQQGSYILVIETDKETIHKKISVCE